MKTIITVKQFIISAITGGLAFFCGIIIGLTIQYFIHEKAKGIPIQMPENQIITRHEAFKSIEGKRIKIAGTGGDHNRTFEMILDDGSWVMVSSNKDNAPLFYNYGPKIQSLTCACECENCDRTQCLDNWLHGRDRCCQEKCNCHKVGTDE